MAVETLPFTVRMVRDSDALAKAVSIRQQAYARHLPALAERLGQAEAPDTELEACVLLAESKLDGSPLGTIRIETNFFGPLPLERSVTLPKSLTRNHLAEATRLGVASGSAGSLVKLALFKAFYQHCLSIGVDAMVIAGRQPIDRMYERLLFADVFPGQGYVPLAHAANVPHRIMHLNVPGAQELWSRSKHPMYGFIIETEHPDIVDNVLSPISKALARNLAAIEAAVRPGGIFGTDQPGQAAGRH